MSATNNDVRTPAVMDEDETIDREGLGGDRSLAVASQSSLEALTRGEVNVQVATAHLYPRSVARSVKEVESLATMDEDVAASCFYHLKRGGKEIEGPSIRLAELFASSWGNLRVGARIIEEGDRFIVAQGVAHDLQTNLFTSIEVQRRITDKHGKRYNDDMIGVTAAAAQSIALRNAILRVIPRTWVERVLGKAKAVAVGDATTLASKRQKWFEWLAKRGVDKARVLGALGCAGEEDVGLEHLERLIGIATAVKEGQTTLEAAFPSVDVVPAPRPTVAQAVAAAAEAKRAEEQPPPKPEEKEPPSPAAQALELSQAIDKADSLPRLSKLEHKIAELPEEFRAQLIAKIAPRREAWGKSAGK